MGKAGDCSTLQVDDFVLEEDLAGTDGHDGVDGVFVAGLGLLDGVAQFKGQREGVGHRGAVNLVRRHGGEGVPGNAVDEECLHLKLRESAAHSVAVDDGKAGNGGGDDGFQGVAAAHFVGDESRGFFADVVFESTEGVEGLDVAHLLDADGGGADAADAGVVVSSSGVRTWTDP